MGLTSTENLGTKLIGKEKESIGLCGDGKVYYYLDDKEHHQTASEMMSII